MGKTRIVAETGAGQHGVATAAACALLGIGCVVYMGSTDIERQAPNVRRMHLLGRRGAAGHDRQRDAPRRAERGAPRLGRERRDHRLHPRLGRRPASVPGPRRRAPVGHRARGARPDARAGRAPAGRRGRVGRRWQQRHRPAAALPRRADAARGRRGRRPRATGSATTRRRSGSGRRASCTARSPCSPRPRRARSSSRTRSRPGSTIPASGRSCRRWPPSGRLEVDAHLRHRCGRQPPPAHPPRRDPAGARAVARARRGRAPAAVARGGQRGASSTSRVAATRISTSSSASWPARDAAPRRAPRPRTPSPVRPARGGRRWSRT